MKTRTLLLSLMIAVAVSALAADVKTAAPSNDASAAFARLKSLAGTWEGDSSMGKIQLTYEVVSNGHVVVEHMKSDALKENMVTTYYLEGDKLALTHYCGLGNQPHMVARKIDLASGDIVFGFAGATNLASEQDKHMHAVTIHLLDPDHFTTAWTLFENASPKMTVTAQYARTK
jgi:hypothetical protein